jgi:hypothetical protein
MPAPAISLLTDFGYQDPYAGILKAVLASLAPGVPVIDISHGVPPQDLLLGGLYWRQALPFFPAGSVHVAVIDPGVGSARRILAARTARAFFVAPDNGLLSLAASDAEILECVAVDDARFFLHPLSQTFHGRDILAPVAARIALGTVLAEFGPPLAARQRLEWPPARRQTIGAGAEAVERISGEILAFDRFGNAISNLRLDDGELPRVLELRVGSTTIRGLARNYQQAAPGEPLAIVGSAGLIEIAVREASARDVLQLRRSQELAVLLSPPREPRS